MKNIYLTDAKKSSELLGYVLGKCIKELSDVKVGEFTLTHHLMFSEEYFKSQNIYITSDEELKADDIDNNICIFKSDYDYFTTLAGKGYGRVKTFGSYFKIIQTNDYELIKNGVQAIDFDFLKWFVKNPGCEYVDVKDSKIVKPNVVNIDLREVELSPMNDLLQDLKETKLSVKYSIDIIVDDFLRDQINLAVQKTLDDIIGRIQNELLDKELKWFKNR